MYNAAQTNEKAHFQALLYDLCQGIEEPDQHMGRPRQSLRDIIFSMAYKVYSTVSTRRFNGDLEDAYAKGYLSKVPHFNTVVKYFDNASLTPILRDLIRESSLCLKSVDVDFAVDSSGFSTSRYVRWYNARYGHEQDNHDRMKVHLMCGVKTNIVTSVEITGRYANDSPQFKPLANATAHNFTMRNIDADKAYSNRYDKRCFSYRCLFGSSQLQNCSKIWRIWPLSCWLSQFRCRILFAQRTHAFSNCWVMQGTLLARRRVLCDEMQHALSRVIAVVAAEEVRAAGIAGIDVDLFSLSFTFALEA